jgi:hypothetical protein
MVFNALLLALCLLCGLLFLRQGRRGPAMMSLGTVLIATGVLVSPPGLWDAAFAFVQGGGVRAFLSLVLTGCGAVLYVTGFAREFVRRRNSPCVAPCTAAFASWPEYPWANHRR